MLKVEKCVFSLSKFCVCHSNVFKLMTGYLFTMFQGAHGFMKTHKWSDTIGAFINIEASGTGGLGRT